MEYYLINCRIDLSLLPYCIGVYARCPADAFRRVREAGYTPLSVEYRSSMRLDS
jgi:hypothetical protein